MTEETWTIEELVALTENVQNGEIEYRGKSFTFQFCELSEKEEPKLKALPENATEDEKNEWYAQIGTDRILSMIEKANLMNSEGINLTKENWSNLPVTLRFAITSEILQLREDIAGNFTSG